MSAKKTETATPPTAKTKAVKAPAKPKTTAKSKALAKSKKVSAKNNLLTLTPKKNPKTLERPFIPGMCETVPGYDAGIPKWLFESGLTLVVHKNWDAKPGDVITVGILVNETTVTPLAVKRIEPGEEAHDSYYFSIDQKDLMDGFYALVYLVSYLGGPDYDLSYALVTWVKTDLPAGDDNDQIEDGHSELMFSLSETNIVPANASGGVTCTVQPYPNMHFQDEIILQWGPVTITQTVAGVGKPTIITVTYEDIVEAGDSHRLLVWFGVRDLVGNMSTPDSANVQVSVALDKEKLDGPVIVGAGPVGYIELETVAEKPVKLQMYTRADVGTAGSIYDVTVRAYPPTGGVIVQHLFATIDEAGLPCSVFVPYLTIRAAAGGRIVASYVLRTPSYPFEILSTLIYAYVRGSIARLDSPCPDGYPDDVIADDPNHIVMQIPYYRYRQSTDRIMLILRFVRALNDVILYEETREVGSNWPENGPVKRLIYGEALKKFKGYRPECYYVILTNFTRTRSINLNESLRRKLIIY